ncbi:hypothetical protein ACFYUH_34740 [Streptomyces fimicarius]|uniref:hypothetical protein n=1 Tax=Streptomyces griseus TaxID=1911 RepID=UPI0036B65AD8
MRRRSAAAAYRTRFPSGHRARRGSCGGRPHVFDPEAYKHRNVVDRSINRLEQWRGIVTRYDKTAQSYEAAVAPPHS